MKKIILLFVFPILLCGQITTTKVNPVKEVPKVQYDSTKNFLGYEVYGYLNQELYLPQKNEKLRGYGWRDFDDDYPTSSMSGGYDYDELVDKYYIVTKIDKAEYSFGDYIFTLEEKKEGKTYYFQYKPSYEFTFPFIVISYYNKMKEKYVGKEFISRGKNTHEKDVYDIVTGKPIVFSNGSIWKCEDLTIDSKYYVLSLLLQNTTGEKLVFSLSRVNDPDYILLKSYADKLKKKYGEQLWQIALSGNARVGMTKELCEVAWGKPKDINKTILTGKVSEQWVYVGGSYLYFDNDLLTGIQ